MKNWLIRILGGVTSIEFAGVFALAAKEREVMLTNNEFYKSQCDARQLRIDYLENLILTKTGYIAASIGGADNGQEKQFQPIGGQNTWGKVKHQLEQRDHKLMQERTKNARH